MRTDSPRLVALAVICLALCAAGPIRAAPPDCEKDPGCLAKWDYAVALSEAGKPAEALQAYREAFELRADPRLWFNIARILHKQHQEPEAASYYQKFLDSEIKDAQQREKAEKYLAQIRAAVPPTPVSPGRGLSLSLAHPAAPTPTDQKVPVYKKAWLWVTLGVVVAGGVTLGLALGLTYPTHAEYSTWRTLSP